MPENTVSVARPTKWGNPYIVQHDPLWNGGRTDAFTGEAIVMDGPWQCTLPRVDGSRSEAGIWFASKEAATLRAVDLFRLRVSELLTGKPIRDALPELRGKNLACWCRLGQPCHADVLLELANGTRPNTVQEEQQND